MITMFLLEKCKSPNFWTCQHLIYVCFPEKKKELEPTILIPRVCAQDSRRTGGRVGNLKEWWDPWSNIHKDYTAHKLRFNHLENICNFRGNRNRVNLINFWDRHQKNARANHRVEMQVFIFSRSVCWLPDWQDGFWSEILLIREMHLGHHSVGLFSVQEIHQTLVKYSWTFLYNSMLYFLEKIGSIGNSCPPTIWTGF